MLPYLCNLSILLPWCGKYIQHERLLTKLQVVCSCDNAWCRLQGCRVAAAASGVLRVTLC
jgi:hypothetical protein